MRFSVKHVDSASVIRSLESRKKRVLPILASEILKDTTRYVPLDTGALRGSGKVESDGKIISWQTPYARRWFYEPANFKTAGTGNRWDLKAKGIHSNSWVQVVERSI